MKSKIKKENLLVVSGTFQDKALVVGRKPKVGVLTLKADKPKKAGTAIVGIIKKRIVSIETASNKKEIPLMKGYTSDALREHGISKSQIRKLGL